MYTVLRVIGDTPITQTTADAINAVSPRTMSPRARNDGFAATVSDSGQWADHVRAIEAFVEAHREPLTQAAARGLSIQFDTQIDSDDLPGRVFTSFGCPPSLHRNLGAIGAWLVLSWYATD